MGGGDGIGARFKKEDSGATIWDDMTSTGRRTRVRRYLARDSCYQR